MSGAKATATFFVALNAEGGVPSEIMLLPAGEAGVIKTNDGRGPYRVVDVAKLVADSMQAAGGRFPIDEAHATDLGAQHGRPAPARGWVVALEARADGIWGRVEWTETGKALLADRAYRGISPVFAETKDHQVLRFLRASLTNIPNLRGMVALHQENDMDLLAQLRKLLGLADDADEAAVIAKIKGMQPDATATQAALQAALAPIAKAAGLQESANAAAILGAVTTLATAKPAGGDVVTALQAEVTALTTRLNDTTKAQATAAATAFVDNAIKLGRVNVKPLRDHYIAMHAADPARVEKEINSFPILGLSGAAIVPPANKDGTIALSAEQQQAAKVLGIKLEDYQKTLAAEAAAA